MFLKTRNKNVKVISLWPAAVKVKNQPSNKTRKNMKESTWKRRSFILRVLPEKNVFNSLITIVWFFQEHYLKIFLKKYFQVMWDKRNNHQLSSSRIVRFLQSPTAKLSFYRHSLLIKFGEIITFFSSLFTIFLQHPFSMKIPASEPLLLCHFERKFLWNNDHNETKKPWKRK